MFLLQYQVVTGDGSFFWLLPSPYCRQTIRVVWNG